MASEISILYHVKENKVIDIINEVGTNYERTLILSTFRSASADVVQDFMQKICIQGNVLKLNQKLKSNDECIKGRGFVIESILLKYKAPIRIIFCNRVTSRTASPTNEFVLQRETKEAEKK